MTAGSITLGSFSAFCYKFCEQVTTGANVWRFLVHAWSEFLFVSLVVILNLFPQINHFYYFTSLHGLQDVENHCAHLRDIELKTGRKISYVRLPHVLFSVLDWRA